MKQYKMASTVLTAVPIFFLATFSAWAEPEAGSETAPTPTAQDVADADAVEAIETVEAAQVADAVETADAVEAVEATGLDLVLDGSTLEAFEKSMEQIKESSTENEYNYLKGALDYLLIYDLGAKRDRGILASRLNGKTGREVTEMVKWRRK